jgi:hypothetical protein
MGWRRDGFERRRRSSSSTRRCSLMLASATSLCSRKSFRLSKATGRLRIFHVTSSPRSAFASSFSRLLISARGFTAGRAGHFHRQLRGITRFPLRHLRLLDPLPSPHCRVRAPLWRTPLPPTVREICDQALFLGKARTLQPTGTPGLKPRWRCRQARRGNPACHRGSRRS